MACILRTYKIGILQLSATKHDDWKQKVEEIKIRRLNHVESTHSHVKNILKLRI